MRRADDGSGWPDWAETEPDPAPPVTIGWFTWHLIWWCSGALAALRGAPPPAHDEVVWPGRAVAAVQRLEILSAEREEALPTLPGSDLERLVAYPWPEPRPLRLALA